MFSLIYKDTLLSKRILPLILGYGIFTIILFDNSMQAGSAGFVASAVAVTYLMVTRAAAYDEMDKAEMMVLSLPISRAKVVLAKYLSVIVFSLIGISSYYIGMLLLRLFRAPIEITPITFESVIGMLFSVAILTSIYFPIYFKWGYIKSRIVNMFLFFGAFFLPVFLTSNLRKGKYEFLNNSNAYLQQQSDAAIIGILLGIGAIFLGISVIISLSFYNRREF